AGAKFTGCEDAGIQIESLREDERTFHCRIEETSVAYWKCRRPVVPSAGSEEQIVFVIQLYFSQQSDNTSTRIDTAVVQYVRGIVDIDDFKIDESGSTV